MDRGGGLTPELCARAIMETVPLVMRVVRAEMRRQGAASMSVPQFRTLGFVARHPGASLTDVADHLGIAAPTASALVDRMVRQGLLKRAGHPNERRRITLTLSQAGMRRLDRARAATRRRIMELVKDLPPIQLRRITGGLDVLARTFREVGPADGGPRSQR